LAQLVEISGSLKVAPIDIVVTRAAEQPAIDIDAQALPDGSSGELPSERTSQRTL
jgi:hypothetical protein